MKKLRKLSINPERVMKKEELITLRGGEDYNGCIQCPGGMVVVCYTLSGNYYHCGWQGRSCLDECDSVVPSGTSYSCQHQFCL